MLEAYIDGSCEPRNPGGTASWGVLVRRLIYDRELPVVNSVRVAWESYGITGSGPGMSNNVGEYSALLALLKWFITRTPEKLQVLSDSQLVVNQMQGKWKVNSDKLFYPYYVSVTRLLAVNFPYIPFIKYRWILREQNLADTLSVKALEEVGIYRRNR